MNVIKAIYNFIAGDMVILVGVLILLAVLLLINNVAALAPIRVITGPVLIIALLAILVATLLREIKPKP
ncbi:hypothetical protein [Dictyobacter formicarum]|uniref:Uncharacterized protein n=1 Tax=Dictyobacter formicarum TaxID=2778368 RepID=A0ABQ3VHQ4_9CHLR|nr:hypothetical protein [Dictyobacter formicarum]GHO85001.1 hypothetical protein KSZ_30070 [Dictyobacter formicarum]